MKGDPVGMEGEDRGTLSPTRILSTGIAFGLLTGLLELAAVAVHRELLGRLTRVSRDVVWMAPAADAAIFAAVALLLAAAGSVWPRLRGVRVVVSTFCALSALALVLLIPGLHPVVLPLLAAGIGVRAGAILARREGRLRRRVPPAIVVMVAVVGLLTLAIPVRAQWSALQSGGDARAPEGAPNVLLLILDTVRAKSLGLYSHDRPTTPELEAWAERGVVFDRAYAPSPWTLPSHGSFFTGRFPHELSTGFFRPLDDTYPTLAEVLAARGYETAGFSANLQYATHVQGLDRGFQRWKDYPVSAGQALLSTTIGRALAGSDPLREALGHQLLNRKPALDVNCDFLRWLDAREPERERRPWFAFLNYFDAHEPYLPPAPFDELLGPEREREPLSHRTGLRAGNEVRRPEAWLKSPEDVAVDLEAYEESVAYVDHATGRLLEALERRGRLKGTLVMIASDHGEQLGEHGLFYHWNSVYSTLLHVPLVAMGPGVPAGRRVQAPVSLRDLPATVMDLAGLTGSPFPGQSLARTWTDGAGERGAGAPAGRAAAVFSELQRGPMFSLVRGPWHYILDVSTRRPREELYHVLRDPDETRDLTAGPAPPEELGTLRRRMIRFLDRVGEDFREGAADGR